MSCSSFLPFLFITLGKVIQEDKILFCNKNLKFLIIHIDFNIFELPITIFYRIKLNDFVSKKKDAKNKNRQDSIKGDAL